MSNLHTVKAFLTALILASSVFLAGCSSVPDEQGDQEIAEDEVVDTGQTSGNEFDFTDDRDPYEDFNRNMWVLNREYLDPMLLRPAATTYEKVPSFFRRGIYNMTENLTEPESVFNNFLQGKPREGLIAASRFLLNSTIGLLGFFDIATQSGIDQEKESFGETLAVWGVAEGPYLMLPGIGPTVVLDRGGDVAETLWSPVSLLSWQLSVVRYSLRGLEQRIQLKELEPMLENSIDEYAFVREAYYSYWLDKVYDGDPPPVEWDDWDDWGEWDDDWDDDWDNSNEDAESW